MADINNKNNTYIFATILVISLFFMWGIANNLNDILIKQFSKAFQLSDFQAGLIQSAFYFGYFICAMPAAIFMQRYGYKGAIMFGLLLYATGAFLFYPAAEIKNYHFFLFALFVIACGLAFLEASANPFIVQTGPANSAERRLNFAQSFNPLGAITGVLIGRNFIFSGVEYSPEEIAALSPTELEHFYTSEAQAVQLPYLSLGCIILLWLGLIMFARFPRPQQEMAAHPMDTHPLTEVCQALKALLHYPHFYLAVIAQFCYVGAQVGIWSYIIRYVQYTIPGTPEKVAADYLTYSLILFMVGRFVGTALMNYIRPANLMACFAITNILLAAMAILLAGYAGLYALIMISFFMSIMFPTIFALGVRDLGKYTKPAASILIMAIIGGAVLTALMGQISDMSTIKIAYIVPLACFTYIAYYALFGCNKRHS